MHRRRPLSVATILAVLASLAFAAAAPAAARSTRGDAADPASHPTSMSALGDSITRGFNANGWYADWPSRSWSTGGNGNVASHYTRLAELDPAMAGHAHNNARTGAKVGALAGQATTSVSQGAEYVTILIGANDACTDTEAQMTSVSAFASRFRAAMDVLATQAPQPRVLVASIPDLRRLWQVGKDSAAARAAWSAYGICQSMLARPRSTEASDVDRRDRVRQRVIAFNGQLAAICSAYSFCRYDGGAVFAYPFSLGQLSGWDYFHPNTSGQGVLADVTWRAGFWATSGLRSGARVSR